MKQITLLSLSLICVSCSQIKYIYIVGKHQASILRSQEEIKSKIQNPNTEEETKRKLQLILDVRKFIQSHLNLKLGDNYTQFVQLKEDYVSYVVNAAPKTQLINHEWSYPIVGKMPYKGYPKKQLAKEEARRMKEQGFDTYIRGVSAYSTLGWFSDPILSSMLRYSDKDLVETIIHESVHATIYIKNNANFNEQLANFIGLQASIEYYKKNKDLNTVKKIEREKQDQILFSQFIAKEIKKLKQWYTQTDPVVSIKERDKKFTAIVTNFDKKIRPHLKSNKYLFFSKIKLNNARLLLFATYTQYYNKFKDIYHFIGNDINKLIDFCKELENFENAEKEILKYWKNLMQKNNVK